MTSHTTTPDHEPGRTVRVTVRVHEGACDADAEPTANPHLVIARRLPDPPDSGEPWYQVVHVPTGLALGVYWLDDRDDCRAVAAALADLDWSDPDPAAYRPGGPHAAYRERVVAALAERFSGALA